MQNHPLINPETGEVEWVARNIAALVMVIGYDRNYKIHILANKRGPKTPDPEFRGCWCMPCGYLDYNETIRQAAAREVFEETGITVVPKSLILFYVNDNPEDDKRQNEVRCSDFRTVSDGRAGRLAAGRLRRRIRLRQIRCMALSKQGQQHRRRDSVRCQPC